MCMGLTLLISYGIAPNAHKGEKMAGMSKEELARMFFEILSNTGKYSKKKKWRNQND